jgi:hypothetical protein
MRALGRQQRLDGRPDLVGDELLGHGQVIEEVAMARDHPAPQQTS